MSPLQSLSKRNGSGSAFMGRIPPKSSLQPEVVVETLLALSAVLKPTATLIPDALQVDTQKYPDLANKSKSGSCWRDEAGERTRSLEKPNKEIEELACFPRDRCGWSLVS